MLQDSISNNLTRIVFDCDGVICDFMEGFYNWYQNKGYTQTHGPISRYPKNWNFDWTGETHIIHAIMTQYINTHPVLKLIDPQWVNMMEKLKPKYQIYIVSHYPDYNGRLNNLQHLGILQGKHYDQLICSKSTEDKVKSIYDLRPKYYIEDAPHVICHLLKHNINWKLDIYIPLTYQYSDQLPTDTSSSPCVRLLRYQSCEDLLKSFLNSESSSS